MIPYSHIDMGDSFQRPYPFGTITWKVEAKDDANQLVLIQAYATDTMAPVNIKIWKSYKDSVSNEQNRCGI